jgi:uncharacterized protein (DUF924 family)
VNVDIDKVLAFWFGREGEKDWGQHRESWWKKEPDFDQACRDGFLEIYEQAARCDLDDWKATWDGSLALVILLDQLPRNMFRGHPRAFATDAHALAVAEHALDQGFDRSLPVDQRMFLYLPFEHSEHLAQQNRSVALFGSLGDDRLVDYAVRHQQIVERFGRFPHRNAILGRANTQEEAAFLQQPGSSF